MATTTYLAKTDDQESFKVVERLDEEMIVAEMQGRAIDKLFYELPIRDPKTGENQIILSWSGVKYLTLQKGSITVEKVELSEDKDQKRYSAIAWAYDRVRDVRVMGAAEQSWNLKRKDGTEERDSFALAKVVSKAQRNALRNLLEESLITEAYKAWKNRGMVPQQPSRDVTPPPTQPLPGKQQEVELRPFIHTFTDPIPAELAEDLKRELDKIIYENPPSKYAIRTGKDASELASVFMKDVPRDAVQLVKNNLVEVERKLIGGGE